AMLVDAHAGLAVALPSERARELAQRLHDQRHALAGRHGAIDLELCASGREIQHAAADDARGRPKGAVPECASARLLAALAPVCALLRGMRGCLRRSRRSARSSAECAAASVMALPSR